MPAELHETSLIALLAIGFVLALLFGLVASLSRCRPSSAISCRHLRRPFHAGFVADSGLANQLAEIGVILLMFGVGLHFSIKDLMSVRYIALPGADRADRDCHGHRRRHGAPARLEFRRGLVFGLSLSVASTVVLLRALEERNALQSRKARSPSAGSS
jgi:CPA2 family monovalent cation:H+ antiporter-2